MVQGLGHFFGYALATKDQLKLMGAAITHSGLSYGRLIFRTVEVHKVFMV